MQDSGCGGNVVQTIPDVHPLSEQQCAVLGVKLAEYQRRVADEARSEDSRVDARHKVAVLSRRLQGVPLRPGEIQEELGDQFDPYYFDNAIGVIEDYIVSGGANVYGGTGLPEA